MVGESQAIGSARTAIEYVSARPDLPWLRCAKWNRSCSPPEDQARHHNIAAQFCWLLDGEGREPMHFRNRQSAVFPSGYDSFRMAVLNENKECQCRRTMLPPNLQRSAPNLLTPHWWFNTSRKAGPGSTALWRSLIGFWIGTCVRTQDLLRGQTDILMAARREGRTVRTACSGREVETSIFETDHPALH